MSEFLLESTESEIVCTKYGRCIQNIYIENGIEGKTIAKNAKENTKKHTANIKRTPANMMQIKYRSEHQNGLKCKIINLVKIMPNENENKFKCCTTRRVYAKSLRVGDDQHEKTGKNM